MKGTNQITNRDAKKIFAEFIAWEFIPSIYIDEYWDYYINLYNLNSTWESFLKQFTKDGFTYRIFLDEYNNILNNTGDTLKDIFTSKLHLLNELNFTDNMPHTKFKDQDEGDYIYVDLHNAFDLALKKIGVFDEYKDTYDVINKFTKYDIFKNIKILRVDIYWKFFTNRTYATIKKIVNQIVLEELYFSDAPILRQIDNTFQFIGKGSMDAFIYKIPEGADPKSVIGDYTYNDIPFSIDVLKSRDIQMFGKKFKVNTIMNKDDNPVHIMLWCDDGLRKKIAPYPFAYKMSLGKELDEKDLAVGYDDQIFFHFDKSNIL